jgi:hypothetical protein
MVLLLEPMRLLFQISRPSYPWTMDIKIKKFPENYGEILTSIGEDFKSLF